MAGIFESFMRGQNMAAHQHRQRQEDEWLANERAYQAQRRGILDERADTQWQDSREDRARTLERDAAEYPLRYRALKQGVQMGDLGLESERFRVNRLPIEAKQADERHREAIAATRQNRGIQAAQESRAAARHRIEQELAELGLNEQRLMASYNDFRAKLGPAGRAFAISGDPKHIENFWNETLGADAPVRIERLDDGTYQSVPVNGGQPQRIGGRDDVLRMVDTFTRSPTAYLDTLHGLRVGQRGAQVPAAVQEIEYIRGILPRREGESDQEHAMRALEYQRLARTPSPDSEFRKIMQQIIEQQTAMPSGKPDVQAAADMARSIMSQRLDERTSAPQNTAPQRPQAPAPQADTPPLPGARRAPDGNWYVKQGGQWYRID